MSDYIPYNELKWMIKIPYCSNYGEWIRYPKWMWIIPIQYFTGNDTITLVKSVTINSIMVNGIGTLLQLIMNNDINTLLQSITVNDSGTLLQSQVLLFYLKLVYVIDLTSPENYT